MSRRPLLVVVLAVVGVLLVSGVVLAATHQRTTGPSRPAASGDDTAWLATVRSQVAGSVGPGLVVRTTSTDERNGQVAELAVAGGRPRQARRVVGPTCDRVYATRATMVCLLTRAGVETTFQAVVLDARRRVLAHWELPGQPSRARVSPSGRLVATTVFVSGESYRQRHFRTATEIRTADGVSEGNLESYDLYVEGRSATARNLWGVTFLDDSTFYATAEVGGRTWLVRGNPATRTLTSVRSNAECPSVSPDGRFVAYKKRVPLHSRHWAVAVLDVATGRERVLGERRSVDDQVEWYDARTLLYGLPRRRTPSVTDVWRIGVTPGARPARLVPEAWSPARVR